MPPVNDLQARRQKGPTSQQAVSFPPVPIYRQTSKKTEVDSILSSHARGWFERAAYLCDEVMTDDRIAGVMETRIGALMSAGVELCPAADRRKERKLAELVGGVDEARGMWPQMVPSSALFEILKWGLLIGVGYGQIVWDRTSPKEWKPRLVAWHPQFLRYDWESRRFIVRTQNMGDILLPDPDENPEGGDGTWVVWAPRGLHLGWLNGLIRSLGHLYVMRQWDYTDWSRFNEKHGQPILQADIPRWASPDSQTLYFEQLANIGSETAVATPVGNTGEGSFGVKLVESMGRNWETFEAFHKRLDVNIAVRVLGQNLTTEVEGGSRAAEQGHDLIRLDKAYEDAQIGNALTLQLLRPWAQVNFGDRNLAPAVKYHVEPPADLKKIGDSYKALGDGLAALAVVEPRVDVPEILQTEGVPLISEEELAAQEAIEAEEEPPPEGGGDGGDPQPDPDKETEPTPDKPPPKDKAKLSAADRPAPRKRYSFAGLAIAVEYPAGTIRSFRMPDGSEGHRKMLCDYGYIEGYLSADGEPLDCYIGPSEQASHVYVVHQLRAPAFQAHDEDKVMLGFPSGDMAQETYLAHRGEQRAFGGMSVIPLDRFRAKLERRAPETTTKIRARAPRAALESATLVALLRLVRRVQLGGTARRKVAGPRKKAAYQDRLRENAQRLAARALAPDLSAIKEEIDLATDFTDLRRRIVERFRSMDPAKLATVVKKANILGHLSGRLDAITEV